MKKIINFIFNNRKQVINIAYKPYDWTITLKKGAGWAVASGGVLFFLSAVQNKPPEFLDVTLGSLLIGGLKALWNWLKNKENKKN